MFSQIVSRKWKVRLILAFVALFAIGGLVAPGQAASAEKTLIIAQAGDVAVIDNQQSTGPAKTALIQIYQWQWMPWRTIVSSKGGLVVKREQVPGIIRAWKTIKKADGTVWKRFHVRPGQVHHSGNPIVAADFKYSWLRRAGLGKDYLHRFLGGMHHISPTGKFKRGDPIPKNSPLEKSIKIIDDLIFEVNVKRDMPFFFDLWGQRVLYDHKLMNSKATAKDPWAKAFAAKNDGGAGPYTIEKWEVGNEMVLKRFEKYWGPRPAIDRLIFRTVPDLSARVLLLKKGDIDVALDIPVREMKSLKSDPNIRVLSTPTSMQLFIEMNANMKPFGNKDLRLALSYAFPYDDIIPAVYDGAATPGYGPIPTGYRGALKERRYKTDLNKAKEHLKKSGLGEGLTLSLKWQTGFTQHKLIGILFKDNLKKIGVNLKLQQLPRGQYNTGRRKRSMDFFFAEVLGWVSSPEYQNTINFSSESNVNYADYKNDRVDQLLVDALKEPDAEKRAKMSDEVQELIMNDVPFIFIAQPDGQLAMRKSVVGYVNQNTLLPHFWMVDKK